MKLLTLNFLTCARKACKSSTASFPLHPRGATLELVETPLNAAFLSNILPRLDWPALRTICSELGLPGLAETMPDESALWEVGPSQEPVASPRILEWDEGGETQQEDEKEPSQLARDLHRLLIETTVKEGKLVCGECGHEYAVNEGIANFLLPAHLV
jgi:multifunctional methyltransferase subunit TRM112